MADRSGVVTYHENDSRNTTFMTMWHEPLNRKVVYSCPARERKACELWVQWKIVNCVHFRKLRRDKVFPLHEHPRVNCGRIAHIMAAHTNDQYTGIKKTHKRHAAWLREVA